VTKRVARTPRSVSAFRIALFRCSGESSGVSLSLGPSSMVTVREGAAALAPRSRARRSGMGGIFARMPFCAATLSRGAPILEPQRRAILAQAKHRSAGAIGYGMATLRGSPLPSTRRKSKTVRAAL